MQSSNRRNHQSQLDIIEATRSYIDRATSCTNGMKALLLDRMSSKVVSMVYSQTEVLSKEVFLVENIANETEPMPHLKCAVILSPTAKSVRLLSQRITNPSYAEYYVFFTGSVGEDLLRDLADADEHEVILEIHEFYLNFLPINEDFFSVAPRPNPFSSLRLSASDPFFNEHLTALLGLPLAMHLPGFSTVRYQASSDRARSLGQALQSRLNVFRESGREGFRGDGPTLILMDRSSDPVSPLLTQWTYQAMIHELLGLDGNITNLKGKTSVAKKEFQELVFSPAQDEFFGSLRYANFGDACNRIQALLQDYQRASKLNDNLDSFQDIMAFIERYPAFRSQSVVATKHVTVMGEMSKQLDERKLMRLSELEQYLVCDAEGETEREYHLEETLNLLSDPSIRHSDKLRLAILFCLRYTMPSSSNRLNRAHEDMVTRVRNCFLSEARASVEEMNTLDRTLDYASENMPSMVFGARNYGEDEESGGGLLGKIRTFASSLQGVSNVFTQHKPLVEKVMELYTKGRLRQSQFPSLSSSREESKQQGGSNSTIRPQQNGTVVVFIIGGATFEEAYKLHELSEGHRTAPSSSSSSEEGQVNPSHTRIVLGGSVLLNSAAFLEEIRK